MSLRGLPLDSVAEGHLRALVSAGVAEGREIEFKRELPGRSDAEGREFLSDVCSFANSGGGDVLYGVEEAGGVAVGVPGVDLPDADAEKLRLDSIARGGLDPRVVGLDVRAVPIAGGRSVVVLRVPRNFARPHAVDYRGRFRFYSRGVAGKFEMDVAQIRAAFLGSESLYERVRSFRAERLAAVAADRGPVAIGGKGVMVLHALPLSAFDAPPAQVNLGKANSEHWDLLDIGGTTGGGPRYNFDGLLRPAPSLGGRPGAYAQLYRNGAVEVADAVALAGRDGVTSYAIASRAFERYMIEPLAKHLAPQEALGVDPPVLAMVSFIGVRGYEMAVSPGDFDEGATIDRDDLVVPEVLFDEHETDVQAVARTMRPAVDAVWNACGFPRSPNYDGDGRWHRMGL